MKLLDADSRLLDFLWEILLKSELNKPYANKNKENVLFMIHNDKD